MSSFPAPGAHVGPYRVVRELGRGGMGVVFEAVDAVLDRRVALKIISPQLAEDPAFRARFTREAQAQASLDSPYVVTVFAHGEIDGNLYIATQLVPGGDLGAVLRHSGAPAPWVAINMIAQVASGLADAHAMGLVHRDIKPANVLLRFREHGVTAYLADFGIARRIDSGGLTTEGSALGTPAYMAPELHTGGRPSPASDVYSLGCLLWAALCGRAPYAGTSDYQVVTAHVSGAVPQLVVSGGWEREANRILRRALAKRPEDRYPTAAALRDDLRALGRQPAPPQVRAAYDAPPPPPSRGSRRRVALVVGAAAAGVALLAVAALGVVLARGDGPSGGGGPASPSTDAHGLTAEEEQVAGEIARVLAANGTVEEADAECVARELVRKRGVDGLVDAGLLDADHHVVDAPSGDLDPGVLGDVLTSGVSCILESSPSGSAS
ncbi:MAG TPA: serine/threonine-protein kinase [Nocardioides sp.]|nr:serine/threonine-protein kinase [Nocardioides sp.]